MALAAVVEHRRIDDPSTRGDLQLMKAELDWMSQALAGHAEPETESLLEVGVEVAHSWQAVASSGGCTVRLVRDPGLWVRADQVGLRRSVRNLIDNAVRAAGPAGEVEVRASAHGGSVEVEVSDSGPGFGKIASQQRLGLKTVQSFAEDHAGRVDVGSSHLGGASVRLVLRRDTAVELPLANSVSA